MLKWGWDTKKTELVTLTRFGCINGNYNGPLRIQL